MLGDKSAAPVNCPSILIVAFWVKYVHSKWDPSLVISISDLSVSWLKWWAGPQLKMNVGNVKNSQQAGMRPCSEGGWADSEMLSMIINLESSLQRAY